MSGDSELDRLKAKKLSEMARRAKLVEGAEKAPRSPRDMLVSALGYRGLEVLENAERQFPAQMRMLVPRMAELVSSGEIGSLDGGKLLTILRMAGLGVRMQTRISVERDGKFISLAEKLARGRSG